MATVWAIASLCVWFRKHGQDTARDHYAGTPVRIRYARAHTRTHAPTHARTHARAGKGWFVIDLLSVLPFEAMVAARGTAARGRLPSGPAVSALRSLPVTCGPTTPARRPPSLPPAVPLRG